MKRCCGFGSLLVFLIAMTVLSRTQSGGFRGRIETHGSQGRRDVESMQIAGLRVAVWKPKDLPAPLIVFSHGFHGCNTQSTFLMKALSEAGYLVVAPDHGDAGCGGSSMLGGAEEPFRNPSAWNDKTYDQRADDVSRLLQALRTDTAWNREIDWTRVGLAGHSLGGYTVLGLAGGWPAWKLPSIKAVLALSPYCQPFADHGRLGDSRIPIMYQGGTRDLGITPFVKRPSGCYDKTSSPAYFVEFEGAGHFAWTDLVPAQQNLIANYSVAFFDKHLRGRAATSLTQKAAGVIELRSK